MHLYRNPTDEELQQLIQLSDQKAAKWIEDPQDGAKWFWPSDQAFHAEVAKNLGIPRFEKGIATL